MALWLRLKTGYIRIHWCTSFFDPNHQSHHPIRTQQNDPIFLAENLLVLISHTAWAPYEGLDVLILGPFLHVLLHFPKGAKGGEKSRR